jgi:hypothetical protein
MLAKLVERRLRSAGLAYGLSVAICAVPFLVTENQRHLSSPAMWFNIGIDLFVWAILGWTSCILGAAIGRAMELRNPFANEPDAATPDQAQQREE